MRIIISRTDSIGDVVLTLPVAAALKEAFPQSHILFLGRNYTRPVIDSCRFVDTFVSWDEIRQSTDPDGVVRSLAALNADAVIHVFPEKEICRAAKKARIPIRIATAGRFFTLSTCNRLLYIPRKNSTLHEAQLNLKLLRGLGIKHDYSLSAIATMYGLVSGTSDRSSGSGKKRVILHPKSKGSAREWGLDNFGQLIDLLPPEKYSVIVTGTNEEGALMKGFLNQYSDRITDLTGKLTLRELMELIANSDALVAASTGPLHLASALGIQAIGIYAPMRPIFPRRWAPIGRRATFLVKEGNCSDCRKTGDCHCIREISPADVAALLMH
jgi:ADP-heptose:LPS heptosyltransferase